MKKHTISAKWYHHLLRWTSVMLIILSVLGGLGLASSLSISGKPDSIQTMDGMEIGPTNWERAAKVTDRTMVMIHLYWEIDCPYCLQQLREFKTWYNALQREGIDNIAIVAINVMDSADDVAKFVEEEGLPYAIWIGGSSENMTGLPFTQLIYKVESGWATADQWYGYRPTEDIMNAIIEDAQQGGEEQ